MRQAIRRIYVEGAVADHPRAVRVRRRFPGAETVPCDRWGELFNRRHQSFRLQKRRPALILARKHGRAVLETPVGYGVGGERNYYFSHMLNCLYDCRYCYLQGMFRSAHYVLFVNYEKFQRAIDERLAEAGDGETWFFSGYDCDSLAFEKVTGFAEEFLPFFAARPRAWLELRTKSVQIDALLARTPVPNCVVAFSFTPAEIHGQLEHGVPSVERRVAAMRSLGERGWRLGLRFDPLIWTEGYRDEYRRLFATVFGALDEAMIHSVSLGGFRLPRAFYDRIWRQHPEERLLAAPLAQDEGMVALPDDREREMLEFCRTELSRQLPERRLFHCG
jgi:spore photoproduct lyase